jgi:nitrate/nitrite transporter NarK
MGLCSNAPAPVIPQWFDKKRSFANAIATAGSGFGGLVYSLATNAMISNLGLAWAFRILAIVAFVVNAFCSLIMRDRNKEVGSIHVAFHRELFRYQEVWLLMAWGIFSILGYIILIFSITDYAQTVGFTAGQGSLAAAMFNCESHIPTHFPTPSPLCCCILTYLSSGSPATTLGGLMLPPLAH